MKQQIDDVGAINIPDKNSFYMILTSTTLNILTSRRNQVTKTIDVIDLNQLKKIDLSTDKEGNMSYKGGLEIMGTFDEGKCIKLNFKSSYS